MIWYSVNGGKYQKYTKALTLSKNTTLKFYAKYGTSKSKTVTRKYTFTPKVEISPNGGKISGSTTVKASSALSGVKCYYTLDGSKPTKNSAVFPKAGITLDNDCTLRVLSVKSGFSSKYYTAEFTSDSKLTIGRSKSILNDYTQKYYYQSITDRQKQVYRDLWNGIKNHQEKIVISVDDLQQWELDYVWWLFSYENPQFFWADMTNYNSTIYLDTNTIYEACIYYYINDTAEEKRIGKIIDSKTNEIIDLALNEKTDYDALASIYASVNRITEYYRTDAVPECSAVGPLVYGKAQCEGYAMALMYLCQSVGIPSVYVAGKTEIEGHGWNKAKINGKWYQLDATFDDNGDESNFGYFCISDKQMAKDHTIETWMPMEGFAAVTDNNYYSHITTVYDNAEKAYQALIKQSAENYWKGIYTTTVYCNDSLVDAVCRKVYANSSDDHSRMGLTYSNGLYFSDFFPNIETGRVTLTLNL